jgi:hypothetical protein
MQKNASAPMPDYFMKFEANGKAVNYTAWQTIVTSLAANLAV